MRSDLTLLLPLSPRREAATSPVSLPALQIYGWRA